MQVWLTEGMKLGISCFKCRVNFPAGMGHVTLTFLARSHNLASMVNGIGLPAAVTDKCTSPPVKFSTAYKRKNCLHSC